MYVRKTDTILQRCCYLQKAKFIHNFMRILEISKKNYDTLVMYLSEQGNITREKSTKEEEQGKLESQKLSNELKTSPH